MLNRVVSAAYIQDLLPAVKLVCYVIFICVIFSALICLLSLPRLFIFFICFKSVYNCSLEPFHDDFKVFARSL